MQDLTLIWVGFLGVRFDLVRRGGRVKLPPSKLKIWYVSTKNQHFLGKNSTFTQSNSVRAVLETF